MRKAICLLVIGEKYLKIFKKSEKHFLDYAKKCGAELKVFFEPLDGSFHRPLLSQKLLLPKFTQEFDMVVFLDLDVLINKTCPSIFDYLPNEKFFGAVLDPRYEEEFVKTWEHIPRILTETNNSYFTDRNFENNENLQGSINGGVFVYRPEKIAKYFTEYYFSDHNQGVLNSFEETPMAYISQTKGFFHALPIKFNTQVLYKLKGTEEGKLVAEEEAAISKFKRRFIYRKKKDEFILTNKYRIWIYELLAKTYILHFAGNYPIPKY